MKSFRLDVNNVFGGDDNSPAIASFLGQFSEVLYAGKGSVPTFLKKLNVSADFPLRCMVGIPEEEFTPARRTLAEAYCQHLLGVDVAAMWTYERPWVPKNTGLTKAPLERCVFDVEWAVGLGIPRGRWEADVLMSTSALSRQTRLPDREGIFAQNVRLLLALAVYGFTDPWQFFTAANTVR